MSRIASVPLINPSLSSGSSDHCNVQQCATNRYRYLKVEGRWLKAVIVDIGANGQEDWVEQAPGECRWYPFTPSGAEREMIRRCRSGAHPTAGPCSVAVR